MKEYIKYLKYVLRHKKFVAKECFAIGRYWRGITHDLSKFLPDEFIPYAKYFYGNYPSWEETKRLPYYSYKNTKEGVSEAFDIAWLKHIHRNKHHWQYWILREDCGGRKILKMPRQYEDEMVCDWHGAGLAINGKKDTITWYKKNSKTMILNKYTKEYIESKLN